MFELQKLIVLAKLKLINKLNRLQNVDTFVKTRKGYKVTGAEGYVAIDKLGGDAVKVGGQNGVQLQQLFTRYFKRMGLNQ